ncbi:histidinol-phosphatase [Pseudohoeflea coraliihabitans]|uniref:Histidinol-phosphatase n=1 Tax=Pseudohoeflea coraliihabitans TaxID=2860393 RepID=A0ABS6WKM9_9HYPH|nr:histidinol-phosphatase [Pseudohoeflea sp. DP4N28-3]MBW3096350.1 histidinol-phosphatase [Pseudohoeflea sp. DP4N28-3]
MVPDLDFLDELADAAAAETLPRFRIGGTISNKLANGFDPVTEADRAAEAAIRARIAARFPDHGILGEEHGLENADSAFRWVIDPIDGTRAFIAGLPVWGTLIGLYHEGRAVMGLMDQPFTGERFVAGTEGAFFARHGGARQPMRSRQGVELSAAILMTTAPSLFSAKERPAFAALEGAVQLSRFGCDCYAFAMVAAGHVDICIEAGLQPYDIAGLIAPIERAGGVVTDWDGNRPEQGGNIIACGSAELHAAALAQMRSAGG